MAKSDEQMGKVKANLLSQKSKIEKRDKIRQMRQQKKFAKDVQKQAKVKKQEERKVAKEEIKMIKKKGEAGVVDFNKVKKEPMKRVNRLYHKRKLNKIFLTGKEILKDGNEECKIWIWRQEGQKKRCRITFWRTTKARTRSERSA
jgi:hypothetical protein